jgi:O-antigen/teichoic acid export membrane protein
MSFARNVTKLVFGSVIAQGLGILVIPALSRIYTPEHFGALALFVSITSIVGSVVCFRYELAIMLPEDDGDAANLFVLSLIITLLVSVITGVILFVAGERILLLFNAQALNEYLWAIPVMIFFLGLFAALNYWYSRIKKFGRLSVARISQSICTYPPRLGLGLSGFICSGSFIVTQVIGQGVSVLFLIVFLFKDKAFPSIKHISFYKIKKNGKRYKNFPIYSSWEALLNTASMHIPPILLALFFDSQIVGYFALGRQMLGLPMTFIGSAISQVFFQKASESKTKGDLSKVVEDIFKFLVSVGLLPFLILTMIGDDVFSIVFGPQWAEAGIYVQMLSLWILFVFISSPLSHLLSVLEKQRIGMQWNIGLFISRIAAICIGGYFNNERLAIALFGVVGVIGFVFYSLLILYYAQVTVTKSVSILVTNLVKAIPYLILVGGLKYFQLDGWAITGFSGLALITFYSLFFYRNRSLIRSYI